MKKKTLAITITFVIITFVLSFAGPGNSSNLLFPEEAENILSSKERKQVLQHLEPRFKQWWEIVYHISTKEERDIFLSLKSDRDRDMFVNAFWQQRDPTPGTEQNEYRDEIQVRYAYVQKYFGRGTSKPGWMTDMGKFYMILGKPNSVESFDSEPGLYPAQVWYYFGDSTLGLPTYFNITFFKPHNTTEWKFYDPLADGPAALLHMNEGPLNNTDYEGLYNKIKELAPALAMPAITMIPNEISPGFRPPLRINIIISNIHESPKKKINLSYATHFLNYKGYVDTDASVNYVENSYLVTVTRYERFPFNFINFSLKPKKISLGYSEEKGQYFFNFTLNASLKKGDDFIYEYKKNYDFYIEPEKVDVLKNNG